MKGNAGMLRRALFLTILILPGLCGLSWAEDCGLRGYDGTEILKLDCEEVGATTSPLRVTLQDGSIRGLKLVDPDPANSTASKFRVRYTDASSGDAVIKAVGKILPGISSCEELQMIGFHPSYPLNGNYVLGADIIDCSATNPANWTKPEYKDKLWQLGYAARFPNGFDGIPNSGDESTVVTGLTLAVLGKKGWNPIGQTAPFTGKLAGQDGVKVINGLYIKRSSEINWSGLFARSLRAQFSNIGLENVNINAYDGAGSLVDNLFSGAITNCHSSGVIVGGSGGLVGSADQSSTITNSYSSASVTGTSFETGGLVGSLYNGSTITRCYSSGVVTGSGVRVGGLVGDLFSSVIIDSFSSGAVTGGQITGGLVGYSASSAITDCYSVGRVKGSLSSGFYNGGLVGYMKDGAIINSFSAGGAGMMTGGGLIGYNVSGALKNNWWFDTWNGRGVGNAWPTTVIKAAAVSDFYERGSGTGGAVYIGTPAWDFTNVWQANASSYPTLRE